MMSEQIKTLTRSRAARKGLITQDFKILDDLEEEEFNVPLLDQYINTIESNLGLVEEFDASIFEELQNAVSDEEMETTLGDTRLYRFSVLQKLAKLKLKREELSKARNAPSPSPVVGNVVKLPLPPIHITSFENNLNNPFEYFNFKKAFRNALAGMPNLTNAQRFIYLKGYLKGDALKLVENITVNDEGYDLAFDQLDFHYLDSENIIDKTLDEILNLSEVRQLKEVESFIRLVSNKVHDLKGLNVDLLERDSSGLMLFSKIVNRKLPRHFLIELSRVTDTTYPNFNQLLNKYQSILARLNLGWNENSGAKPKKTETSMDSSENSKTKGANVKQQENPNNKKSKSGENNASSSVGKCKFCPGLGHASHKCSVYKTLDARKSRALALGLCSKCLNNKHKAGDCPGNKAALPYKCFSCSKAEHHGALCPQSLKENPDKKMFNVHMGSDIFVPVINLTVGRQNKSVKCSFLIDTGAQFSIINKQLVDKRVGVCLSPLMSRNVSSFDVPMRKSKGFNYPADLTLPSGQKVYCIFFAMDDFRLNVQVPMMKSVVHNMESSGYALSPDFPRLDNIVVHGILGNDILQYFSHLSLESASVFNKVGAKLVRLANGYIPFGSVLNFLKPEEEESFLNKIERKEFPWIENPPISGCEQFDDDILHSDKAKPCVVKSPVKVPPSKGKQTEPRCDDDHIKPFPS